MGATTVGANLTAMSGPIAAVVGRGLHLLQRFLAEQGKTTYSKGNMKVFVKAGAPVTNTAADSPGSNLCLVWDKTNSDLYLIYAWSASTTFTALKIVD